MSICCPICSSEKITKSNKHLFLYIKCLNCFHESILSKEENLSKFVQKSIKKDSQRLISSLENVIEYSFCPYWTLMKNIHSITSIVIKKPKEQIMIHSFSEKSIREYAKNIMIPNSIIENSDYFIINLHI